MEDIENYEKMGGLKNEISIMVAQQYAICQITAPREKAIAVLMKLQALGVTDREILEYLRMAQQDARKTFQLIYFMLSSMFLLFII